MGCGQGQAGTNKSEEGDGLHPEILPSLLQAGPIHDVWGAKQTGNKDGTEVGVPGYSEQTHGHQGIRTSLGETASVDGVVMQGVV